jgi:acetylglutamate kinase
VVLSDVPLPATAEALLTFLESVGRRSEAELYVKLFRTLPRPSFALVAADYLVVRHAIGSLAEQAGFLSQLGLVAPLVVGLFNPETAERGAEALAEVLPNKGLLPKIHDFGEPDLAACLSAELSVGALPILRFPVKPGEPPRERFAALGELAGELATRKVVVLRQRGGIMLREDAGGTLPGLASASGRVSVINLRSDLDAVVGSGLLRQDDYKLLELVQALLGEAQNSRLTLSITSPFTLLRELFTVKGDGTLVKSGAEIRRATSYEELDLPRLTQLLERSFDKKLRSGLFARPPLAVYFEAAYRGAAIVEPTQVAPYLTKFAVEPLAQGEGMGRDLWSVLTREQPRLIWRARARNPISAWYATQCDGLIRLPEWHVFWRGIKPEHTSDAIFEALARPVDFDA